jgi:DivIVA domain-containing protein
MKQDDPEKRIAELERQLAQLRADVPAAGTSGRLTAEQVHSVLFAKPPLFKRGYNEDEVDEFLDTVETTLRDPTAPGAVTAADVRAVKFSQPDVGKRGYNVDEVDEFLDLIESELARRSSGA